MIMVRARILIEVFAVSVWSGHDVFQVSILRGQRHLYKKPSKTNEYRRAEQRAGAAARP